MSPVIEAEIKKFEALQDQFAEFGARDSDSEGVFQMLIAHAINQDPLALDAQIPWDLYDEEDVDDPKGLDRAVQEMTEQGWTVYRVIQAHATPSDVEELKKYCWRIAREEFEPIGNFGR